MLAAAGLSWTAAKETPKAVSKACWRSALRVVASTYYKAVSEALVGAARWRDIGEAGTARAKRTSIVQLAPAVYMFRYLPAACMMYGRSRSHCTGTRPPLAVAVTTSSQCITRSRCLFGIHLRPHPSTSESSSLLLPGFLLPCYATEDFHDLQLPERKHTASMRPELSV